MNGLKEWATVVKALESGDQTVILRKGGILEVASGFLVESKKFLLFPTYEHQTYDNLKPQFHKYLDIAMGQKPKDGQNKITSYAEVLAESDVLSDDKINRLSQFHIWSDPYIATRRNWMPDKPMKAVFLKVFKVPEFEIPLKPEYQGCKSWIDINANLISGESVLSKTELDLRLEKFMEIVN
ncbi:MAG TPA: DUF1802 family protein [Candidatus Nitrosotenuis sp.]|jgi:hypothetical protein